MMSAITQNSSLSLANGHTNGESFLLFGKNWTSRSRVFKAT